MVNMKITVFSCDKGPGLFRFRNDLLQDEVFIKSVRDEIKKAVEGDEVYNDVIDWGLKLEMILSQVRVNSIKRSKQITNKKREECDAAYGMLERYEIEMTNNPSDNILTQFAEAKRRVTEIEDEKGKRAMLYSGAQWI